MDAIAYQRARLGKAAAAFVARPQKLLIDGEWVAAKSGKTFASVDPATGLEITRLAEGDAADVDLAARAARRAFEGGDWPRLRPRDRERLLLKLADRRSEAHTSELQ